MKKIRKLFVLMILAVWQSCWWQARPWPAVRSNWPWTARRIRISAAPISGPKPSATILESKGQKVKLYPRDALGGEDEKLDQVSQGLLEISNSDLAKAGSLDPTIFRILSALSVRGHGPFLQDHEQDGPAGQNQCRPHQTRRAGVGRSSPGLHDRHCHHQKSSSRPRPTLQGCACAHWIKSRPSGSKSGAPMRSLFPGRKSTTPCRPALPTAT